MAIILFADNDMNFLKIRREFLENEGHIIISASTPTEAWKQLKQDQIDLAILDIRLIDDDDEKDISGLNLARERTFRSIPKIMLTGFPSVHAVREAMGPELDGLPAAVDFVAKQDGPKVLADAVRQIRRIEAVRDNGDKKDERGKIDITLSSLTQPTNL